MNYGPRSNFLYIVTPFYFTRTVYFYLHTIILLPLDTLNPLFTANRWDWQPHRKLGAKYLVVLCGGSALQLAKQSLDEAPYKLSWAIASYQASPSVIWLLPLLIDIPWFLNWGKNLAAIFIIPSSWGSQLDGEKLSTPYHINTQVTPKDCPPRKNHPPLLQLMHTFPLTRSHKHAWSKQVDKNGVHNMHLYS